VSANEEKDRMRLAVFTSKYPARVSTFFERDLRSLLETGLDIDVFSIAPLDETLWRHSLDLLGPAHLPRSRVHHLPLARSLRLATPIVRRLATATRDAARVLTAAARFGPTRLGKTAYVLPKAWTWALQHANRYDHVLAYWGNYAGTCAYAFHRLAAPRVPFSIWLHAGTDLYRSPVFLREKLRYADNVITCCDFNRGYILKNFADVQDIDRKLHVCHHGLDLSGFPPRFDGRAHNRVLAVGRLSKRKGFDYLIRATHLLCARGVDVTVEFLGDGDERQRLHSLATEVGVADRVRFRGWLPFAEVRQAMNEATLLVHPSDGLGDGLPNVVREAMAFGLPVIASDVAGIPDALSGGCGVLVPPKNEDELAAAIERLLHEPEERIRIARRARARTEEHYDLWRNGARLAQLLRDTRRPAGRNPVAASATLQEREAC
jgi:glycosyltransferase involved in cell wall biosynthesis